MFSRPCLNLQVLDSSHDFDHIGCNIPSFLTRSDSCRASFGGDYDGDGFPSLVHNIKRIIVVANQLPIKASLSSSGNGKHQFELDRDAITLQLREGFGPDVEFVHVGCLKAKIDPVDHDRISDLLMENFNCLPVFLSQRLQDKFYHEFCKSYLWPILHYKLPMSPSGKAESGGREWHSYVSANMEFTNKIMEVIGDEDSQEFVWVQDYHLMLIPTLLRRRVHGVKLGFFIHSPFPSSEMFRIVPICEEMLRGLLNSDLIGFHTFDYARHFLSCCRRSLGMDYSSKRGCLELDYYGRTVGIKIQPTGIHLGQLRTLMSKPETIIRARELKEKYKDKTVIIGVDDMDVLKGISFKFLAFDYLLGKNPYLIGKVVLIQIANPARTRGEEIAAVENEVRTLASEVNAKYSRPGYGPIVLIEDPVSSSEKVAYYSISDCCFLNAIRDGMNLVPFEYTVCREGTPELNSALGVTVKKSVIIVSELVGCSPTLGGAIRVNPFNVDQVADAIRTSVYLSDQERERKHGKHFRYISSHDIAHWAQSFDHDLTRACLGSLFRRCWGFGFGLTFRLVWSERGFRRLSTEDVKQGYRSTSNRLFLLDYDGTLAPQSAIERAPSTEAILLLNELCSDPKNTVFIVSGRRRENLDDMFSPCEKLGLSAEHGNFFRWKKVMPWESRNAGRDFEWKSAVQPIMQHYAEATDGCFVEERETAMVWHFQDTDLEFGTMQAKELVDHLQSVLANLPVIVTRSELDVEVKPRGVNKGVVMRNLLSAMESIKGEAPDFVLCIGDDNNDEDMFEIINEYLRNPELPSTSEVFTCIVGQKATKAKFFVKDTSEVLKLLSGLTGVPINVPNPPESHEAGTSGIVNIPNTPEFFIAGPPGYGGQQEEEEEKQDDGEEEKEEDDDGEEEEEEEEEEQDDGEDEEEKQGGGKDGDNGF